MRVTMKFMLSLKFMDDLKLTNILGSTLLFLFVIARRGGPHCVLSVLLSVLGTLIVSLTRLKFPKLMGL